MKRCFNLVLLLLLSSIVQAQQSFDELIPESKFAGSQITNIIQSLKQIQAYNRHNNNLDSQSDVLIIGDDDPNETVTITGSFFLNGNLQIINNGRLILDDAVFQINGNIEVSGTGELIATGGSFEVIQTFTYEHNIVIFESGLFKLDSVQFSSSGQSWGVTAINNGEYILKNSVITDGFITTGLIEQASAQITGS